MRLRLAVRTRRERDVDIEPVVLDEVVEVASRVGDEAELQARARERPRTGNTSSKRSKLAECSHARVISTAQSYARLRVAAHAADDPFGERDPDLVVVVELGMTLEVSTAWMRASW